MREFDYITSPAKLLTPEIVQMVGNLRYPPCCVTILCYAIRQEMFLSYHYSNIPYYNSLIAPEEVFVLALCQDHPSHFLLPLYLQLCLIHFLMHLIRTQRIPYYLG